MKPEKQSFDRVNTEGQRRHFLSGIVKSVEWIKEWFDTITTKRN